MSAKWKWNTGDIEKLWKCKSFGCCGTTAPSRNFFANFIAEFQKQHGKNTLLLYVEGTGKSNAGRLSVPSVYEKYQKRGSMAG